MKVKLNDTLEIELKYSMRLYLIHESICKEAPDFTNLGYNSLALLFYSTILASMQSARLNLDYTYQEFLDLLDEGGMPLMNEFAEWFTKQLTLQSEIVSKEEEQTTDKPKKKAVKKK